ncbi:MAG: hypothetical protein DRP93_07125 [Candidatus Neomarinimicrobiota bacterium]|nr:MAG: hypothetical protein DRP93_07125 [Candidatus Neomarinimicrobiota bacterium]
MRHFLLILFVIFSLASCINNDETEVEITVDAQLAYDLLNNSSDTLNIADRNYILEAFMWRDFMPGDNDDHSLTSVNHLVALDSLLMPSYLDLTKQYVILNDSIWITDYTDQRDNLYDYKLSRVSREGPEWGINKSVSVVAEVTNTTADSIYYIKVENVVISATY